MVVRSSPAGIIEIEMGIGETFPLWTRPSYRHISRFNGRSECDSEAWTILAADLTQLRDELDGEYRRLLARLAA